MNYSNCKIVEKGAQFIHGNYTGEAYTYAHWQAVKSGRRSYGDATFCPAFFGRFWSGKNPQLTDVSPPL